MQTCEEEKSIILIFSSVSSAKTSKDPSGMKQILEIEFKPRDKTSETSNRLSFIALDRYISNMSIVSAYNEVRVKARITY